MPFPMGSAILYPSLLILVKSLKLCTRCWQERKAFLAVIVLQAAASKENQEKPPGNPWMKTYVFNWVLFSGNFHPFVCGGASSWRQWQRHRASHPLPLAEISGYWFWWKIKKQNRSCRLEQNDRWRKLQSRCKICLIIQGSQFTSNQIF